MLQYVIAGRLLLLPQKSQRAQVYADRQLRDQDRKQAGRNFKQVCLFSLFVKCIIQYILEQANSYK